MAQVNKAHLTPPKRRLIELMQDINFGRITNIPVRDGEPELTPDTVIERDQAGRTKRSPARARPG